jgi:hypothetical protein
VAHPGEPHVPSRHGAGAVPRTQDEIGRIKGQLAELERRLQAIDPNA